MRLLRFGALVPAMFAAACLTAATARAEPIRVFGGQAVVFFPDATAGAALLGSELFVTGPGTATTALPVQPGATGTLDGTVTFTPSPQLYTMIVGGVPYPQATLAGSLSFVTTPFTVPPPVDGQGAFETTFTMTGHVTGLSSAAPGASQLFSLDLFGSGRAVADATFDSSGGLYSPSGPATVHYEFLGEPPQPAPEPATVLLMGGGLLSLLLFDSFFKRCGSASVRLRSIARAASSGVKASRWHYRLASSASSSSCSNAPVRSLPARS